MKIKAINAASLAYLALFLIDVLGFSKNIKYFLVELKTKMRLP